MNRKAESLRFIIIICAALIIIGLVFVMLSKNTSVSGKTVYSEETCYSLIDNKLSTASTEFCCSEIKKSSGCEPYNNGLFVCKGDTIVVVNKETILSC